METASDNQAAILDFARRHGPFRPRDVAALGTHPQDIQRLCRKGLITRIARGLYQLADAEPDPHQSLVEACARIPLGVICLLSALRYHGIGTQLPHRVWLAIPNKAARPRIEYPPLELTYLTDRMHQLGIEERPVSNSTIRVYSVTKTVVDCFRFRNKVGLDVAIEALRDVLTRHRHFHVSVGELHQCARQCRVEKVLTPYIEATLG